MKGSTSSVYTPSRLSGKLYSDFLKIVDESGSLIDDEALQVHWNVFPAAARQFILSTLDNLSLQKLIDFWSVHADFTMGSIAGGIYGASWYLGLIYLKRGELSMARSMTLNGSFLQECCYQSLERIKEIVYICTHSKTSLKWKDLPHLYDGLQVTRSTVSTQSLYSFLERSLPQEYQQMLTSFVSMGTKSRVMNFVGNVTSDWESTSSKVSSKKSRSSHIDDKKISLIIGGESYQVGTSTPMKTLFNEYAEKNSQSLKLLRFSFSGKTLFLSSAGKKSPTELGMVHGDTVEVQSNQDALLRDVNKASPHKDQSDEPKKQKKGSKKIRSKSKKSSKIEKAVGSNDNGTYKIEHSKIMSKLFEEADPKFRLIRQELNALNLLKQQPKPKIQTQHPLQVKASPACNPTIDGLGDKAGKTCFVLNIGEVNNLYKSSKSLIRPLTMSTIDLHGCSREEATARLDAGLKDWNELAMLGSYPFVHSVTVICGGGGQVLSEVVEKWISLNQNVCNAPRR